MQRLQDWIIVQGMDKKKIVKIIYTRLSELCEKSNGSLTIESLEGRLSKELNMEKSYFLFIKFMFYVAEDLTNAYIEDQNNWCNDEILNGIFTGLKREYQSKYKN